VLGEAAGPGGVSWASFVAGALRKRSVGLSRGNWLMYRACLGMLAKCSGTGIHICCMHACQNSWCLQPVEVLSLQGYDSSKVQRPDVKLVEFVQSSSDQIMQMELARK
jgi:hypothetical protein